MNGKDVKLPTVPFELIVLRYRERFHISYKQFLETPWEIIIQDLEIWEIENDIKEYKLRQK